MAGEVSALRIPVEPEKIAGRMSGESEAYEYKPFNEMKFEELIWWYKSLFIAVNMEFAHEKSFYEVKKIVEEKYKIKKGDVCKGSFYIWVKRLYNKECLIPQLMYKEFYKQDYSELEKLKYLHMEMKIAMDKKWDSAQERIVIFKNYIVMMMQIVEGLKELTYKDERLFDIFCRDSQWQKDIGAYIGQDCNPDVLSNVPPLLTGDDVIRYVPDLEENVTRAGTDL